MQTPSPSFPLYYDDDERSHAGERANTPEARVLVRSQIIAIIKNFQRLPIHTKNNVMNEHPGIMRSPRAHRQKPTGTSGFPWIAAAPREDIKARRAYWRRERQFLLRFPNVRYVILYRAGVCLDSVGNV